jgi:AcrR family transcriptional regulator
MHFRDKDEILVEICQGAMEQMLTLAAQIATQDKPPAERARDMIEAYIRFGLDNPSTYRLVFCSHGRHLSPESQAPVEMLGDRCFQKLHNVVAEIAEQGRLKSPGALVAAQVLWSAGHGLVSLMITQPDRQWAPAPVLTTALLDGVFDGLLRP